MGERPGLGRFEREASLLSPHLFPPQLSGKISTSLEYSQSTSDTGRPRRRCTCSSLRGTKLMSFRGTASYLKGPFTVSRSCVPTDTSVRFLCQTFTLFPYALLRVCTCVCVCMCACVLRARACVCVWVRLASACAHACMCICAQNRKYLQSNYVLLFKQVWHLALNPAPPQLSLSIVHGRSPFENCRLAKRQHKIVYFLLYFFLENGHVRHGTQENDAFVAPIC